MEEEASNQSEWYVINRRFPRSQITFLCQILIVAIIVVSALINLSLENGDKTLWSTLLASSLGYVLPNPSIKSRKHIQSSNSLV
jgi:hypothetical protein